jgi:hypothetical protein
LFVAINSTITTVLSYIFQNGSYEQGFSYKVYLSKTNLKLGENPSALMVVVYFSINGL